MFEHGFPSHWSTIKKLIWLKGAGIIGGASAIWKTLTGTLIHLTDALASPMQKCEVTLEPIQDLHGQDAPYPAGGGVNKFDQETLSDFTNYTNQVSSYYYTGKIQLKPNTNYYIYPTDDTSLSSGYYVLYIVQGNDPDEISITNASVIYPVYGGAIGTPQANRVFTTKETGIIRFGVASSAVLESIMTKTWQMAERVGNYDPYTDGVDYSPYSNICPITGWTGCEVRTSNENLLDVQVSSGAIRRYYYGTGFLLKKGVKYTLTYDTSKTTAIAVYFRNINDTAGPDNCTVTGNGGIKPTCTPNEDVLVSFKTYAASASTYPDNFILELTTDENAQIVEHQGTTASVTFPDTVYGGKYEFVSGVGESNKQKIVPTNYTIVTERVNGYYCRLVCQTFIVDNNIEYMANIAKIGTYYPEDSIGELRIAPPGAIGSSQTFFHCWIPNTLIDYDPQGSTSLVDCIKRDLPLANWEISAPLPTPVPISLTPQPISTLAGENNVWSNGDSVEIIYKAQA